jgi:predicted esterase
MIFRNTATDPSMILPRRAMPLTAALIVCLPLPILAASPSSGYHAHVNVTAPTRLDWSFVVLTRSLASPPADWLPDYEARRQQYELFVPPRKDPRRALPLLLFVSPGGEAMGWKHFEKLCKQRGFLFAGPHHAGNDCPPRKRVRIVLDVLDDVRRHYPVDPDRTYLVGFSGGGRIACGIAFALPEYFGGVMSLGAAHELRGESWLRQRVIDRLSVALMAGEKDFNRGEVERWRGPLLKDVGVRTRITIEPELGHSIPSTPLLDEGLHWLEEGVAQRRQLARRYPAARVPADAQPSREASARALFAEARLRLEKRETLYSGLMQLQGCMQRWPDLEVGAEARKILQDYEDRKEHPWEAEDIAEQRRFLIAEARALDAYATGDLPAQYDRMRLDMARKALELWQKVLADNPDNVEGQEARKRIPSLERLVHMGHS